MADEFDQEDPTNPAHYEGEPKEEVSEPESQEEASQLSETEKIAQQVGWAPKDQWRGNPDQWRPAADFLRKGVEIHNDLRARLDKQEQVFNERVQRSERMADLALEKQRRLLEEQYKAQMRYAASQGDMEVYSAVEKNRDQALEKFDEETAPVRQAPQRNPNLPPETVQFVERNASWFNRDPVMTGAAVALCGELQERHAHLPLSSIMNMVEESMRNEFPHKFNAGNKTETPRGPARVEGGQRPIKTTAKKGWDQLPPEAKRAGTKNIKQGLFGSDDAKARAQYAQEYWDQE